MAYFPANLNSMNNQSSAAIDCLKSYLDFAGKIEERKEILATIEFLENILKYSYGEILEKLK